MAGFNECSIDDVLKDKSTEYRHGAHCIIWAPWNNLVFGQYATKAAILMQVRFDGSFGFCGGLVDVKVDAQDDIIDALNRELVEEINLDMEKFKLTGDNYAFSHVDNERKSCYHFYSYKVDIEDLKAIERDALSAEEYGNEVFGLVRVPLYTMADGVRGFPTFLKNKFIGNAKDQLLKSLKLSQILTDSEMETALNV